MVCTIGSLVKETSKRRWLVASSLHTASAFAASAVLGASLGLLGGLAGNTIHYVVPGLAISPTGAVVAGLAAGSYALSDLGWLRLPRPYLMPAVPVTWWRKWRVYRASVLYGAVLGLGVTTRIPFGAFYIVLAWCAIRGDTVYGALVMGTYGLARGVTIYPASCAVLHRLGSKEAWPEAPLLEPTRARLLAAGLLLLFASATLASAVPRAAPLPFQNPPRLFREAVRGWQEGDIARQPPRVPGWEDDIFLSRQNASSWPALD